MTHVKLYAVKPEGPVQLTPVTPLDSIYDLPDTLPYGVYTVMRTFNHNKFLGLTDHLDRLEQSIALLGWSYRPDRRAIRKALHEVCTAYPQPDARVRLDVLAGPAEELGTTSRDLITLSPFEPVPAICYQEGVQVAVARQLQRRQPRAKTADFVLARRNYPAGRPEAFEYLLISEDGRILEGSGSNFYAIRSGLLWTAGEGVLEGITRKIVLRLAPQLGIPVRLEAVALTDVPHLDEAFMSGSSRGLIPIVSVDGETVGKGRPGPITRNLMAAYEEYVAQAIRPAIDVEDAPSMTDKDGGATTFRDDPKSA